MRGKVSIYINHKKHDEFDENDDSTESKVFSETENNQLNSSSFTKSKKFREKLGNYVTSLGKNDFRHSLLILNFFFAFHLLDIRTKIF